MNLKKIPKTSLDRVNLYIKNIKKYYKSLIKPVQLKALFKISDISEKDMEDLEKKVRNVLNNVSSLDNSNSQKALRELDKIYVYTLHERELFSLFLNLYKKNYIASRFNTKRLVHFYKQADILGLSNLVDKDFVLENKSSLLDNSKLILYIFFVIIIAILTFYSFFKFFTNNAKKRLEEGKDLNLTNKEFVKNSINLPLKNLNLKAEESDYYLEVQSSNLIVGEDFYSYSIKMGLISKLYPIKKIEYSLEVFDDLENLVFQEDFQYSSNSKYLTDTSLYIPLDVIYTIPNKINFNVKYARVNILSIDYYEEKLNDDYVKPNIILYNGAVKIALLQSYFSEKFELLENNAIIEVFNQRGSSISYLTLEIEYLTKTNTTIKLIERNLINNNKSFISPNSSQRFLITSFFPKELFSNIKEEILSLNLKKVIIE